MGAASSGAFVFRLGGAGNRPVQEQIAFFGNIQTFLLHIAARRRLKAHRFQLVFHPFDRAGRQKQSYHKRNGYPDPRNGFLRKIERIIGRFVSCLRDKIVAKLRKGIKRAGKIPAGKVGLQLFADIAYTVIGKGIYRVAVGGYVPVVFLRTSYSQSNRRHTPTSSRRQELLSSGQRYPASA